jgi:phage host-nuclease inhibitor protein Gam
MSKKKKIKADAVTHWVPADRDQVNAAIAEIGTLQRERVRLEAEMNDELEAVKARYNADTKPMGERIGELSLGVKLYCEANRAKLTNDGRVKFHDFATGKVNWRLTPWACTLKKVDEVLALLKAKGLTQYIRKKEEVDKDALLADRTTLAEPIPGVTFSQKEEFAIEPSAAKIEDVQA